VLPFFFILVASKLRNKFHIFKQKKKNMKTIISNLAAVLFFAACATSQTPTLKYLDEVNNQHKSVFENGSVKISNSDIEYEVIIIDNQFESWFARRSRPRGYHSKTFLESKNRQWIQSFNARSRAGVRGFDYTIDFQSNIDYGYEVNYMIYNYLLYFQETNDIRLD